MMIPARSLLTIERRARFCWISIEKSARMEPTGDDVSSRIRRLPSVATRKRLALGGQVSYDLVDSLDALGAAADCCFSR